jgi:hypothetical protein
MLKSGRPVAEGSYIDRAAGFRRRQLPVESSDHPGLILVPTVRVGAKGWIKGFYIRNFMLPPLRTAMANRWLAGYGLRLLNKIWEKQMLSTKTVVFWVVITYDSPIGFCHTFGGTYLRPSYAMKLATASSSEALATIHRTQCCLHFLSWRRRWHVPPKRWQLDKWS